MTDLVNHPAHYTDHPSGIECLTVTRLMSFDLGNAVKYIWRAGEKADASPDVDLAKARFYLLDTIANGLTCYPPHRARGLLEDAAAHDTEWRAHLLRLIANGNLSEAAQVIGELIGS